MKNFFINHKFKYILSIIISATMLICFCLNFTETVVESNMGTLKNMYTGFNYFIVLFQTPYLFQLDIHLGVLSLLFFIIYIFFIIILMISIVLLIFEFLPKLKNKIISKILNWVYNLSILVLFALYIAIFAMLIKYVDSHGGTAINMQLGLILGFAAGILMPIFSLTKLKSLFVLMVFATAMIVPVIIVFA